MTSATPNVLNSAVAVRKILEAFLNLINVRAGAFEVLKKLKGRLLNSFSQNPTSINFETLTYKRVGKRMRP
jgi:hypothetical protein